MLFGVTGGQSMKVNVKTYYSFQLNLIFTYVLYTGTMFYNKSILEESPVNFKYIFSHNQKQF